MTIHHHHPPTRGRTVKFIRRPDLDAHTRIDIVTQAWLNQANALWADYGSCSTYAMVSPLHPGQSICGMPPRYSPRNLAAPTTTSMIASLTNISSPQTPQR